MTVSRNLILFALGNLLIWTVVFFFFAESIREDKLVFSEKFLLESMWEEYKEMYIEESSFRTVDRQANGITTSEGQSYTLLRAVWQDDKEVFDKSFQWTKDNIRRSDSNLFSWLFGELENGTYGVQDVNTASDANVDIALSLLFAYSRWNDDSYLNDARGIINDIWEQEVMVINGKPVLVANNVEKTINKQTVLVNPSYFSPYAFKIFAQVDPTHNWIALADSSYEILAKSITNLLDTEVGYLPPNWVEMDVTSGAILASNNPSLSTNFGYDALRIPLRIGLDYVWFKDERALAILTSLDFLQREWTDKKQIYASYTHDGRVVERSENLALYGGVLPYFAIIHPNLAEEIYYEKILSAHNLDTFRWHESQSYYASNIAWFGLAFYFNELPNLYALKQIN